MNLQENKNFETFNKKQSFENLNQQATSPLRLKYRLNKNNDIE